MRLNKTIVLAFLTLCLPRLGPANDLDAPRFDGMYCGQCVSPKTLENWVVAAAPDKAPPLTAANNAPDRQAIAGSFGKLLALAEARPLVPVFDRIGENYSGRFPESPDKTGAGSIVSSRGNGLPEALSAQDGLISVLKDIFQKEGVPHNFVWMAEVESAMNPEAESSAGAMGLFQLMPDTAKRFGLKIFPADERKTPEKSARAAACYLRHLREEFGGWALALAAYNAGEGRVSRAMKLNNARTFREVAPFLPSETRRYVPRVMTTIALREDQRLGVPAALYMP